MPNQPENDHLIDAAEVRRLLGGICDMTLWRLARHESDFPAPIRLSSGGRRYYLRAEILAWRESRRERQGEAA